MAERVREQLEITDDSEWRAIEPLVSQGGRSPPGGWFWRSRLWWTRRSRRWWPWFGGQQQADPAADALQRAIDAKASNAETKAALEKFVADRKAKQAALEKAQADLRKVLTPRQEAIATLNGLL
jgi:hypothetical protein